MSRRSLEHCFDSRTFVGREDHCAACGGTIAEHASIMFTEVFTARELQNPNHPYHEQYLKLIQRETS
jgi:hypothetical protein